MPFLIGVHESIAGVAFSAFGGGYTASFSEPGNTVADPRNRSGDFRARDEGVPTIHAAAPVGVDKVHSRCSHFDQKLPAPGTGRSSGT